MGMFFLPYVESVGRHYTVCKHCTFISQKEALFWRISHLQLSLHCVALLIMSSSCWVLIVHQVWSHLCLCQSGREINGLGLVLICLHEPIWGHLLILGRCLSRLGLRGSWSPLPPF